MASSRLGLYAALALAVFVASIVLVGYARPIPLGPFYQGALFANISGFAAIFLIGGTGVMMSFRRSLLGRTRSPDALRELHILLAALGGLFLAIHVGFFLLFPLTLPVLFGYLGTYASFVVWITGATFLEGFRGSLFYHGLLSLVGVSLIVVHVFSAGRGIPLFASGSVLVVIAAVVIAGAVKELAGLPPGRTSPVGD